MWRAGRARSVIRTVTYAVTATTIIAVLLTACGNDDPAPPPTTVAPSTSSAAGAVVTTTTQPSEAAMANADGQIATVLGTFPLRVLTCQLHDDGSVVLVAETEDGAGRLELNRAVGTATLDFTLDHGDGEPIMWAVTDAVPLVDGTIVSYEGPSQVSGQEVADTAITVGISC